jgi:hypothetical protein
VEFFCTVLGRGGRLPMRISEQTVDGQLEFLLIITSDPPYCDPRRLSIEDARRLRDWLSESRGEA